jgi:dTDP-4-amino-4,6-dideoxygalactose transaminase
MAAPVPDSCRRFGRGHRGLDITDQTSASLIRLPLHGGISSANIDTVIERLRAHLQPAS